MLEVESHDMVCQCLERVQDAGITVTSTLGRHVNDNMCSFYVLAPGGIAVEYGYDGLLVDWDTHTPSVLTVATWVSGSISSPS